MSSPISVTAVVSEQGSQCRAWSGHSVNEAGKGGDHKIQRSCRVSLKMSGIQPPVESSQKQGSPYR